MANEEGVEQRLVHLKVKSGPDAGRMFFIKPKKEALIGRVPSSDLRLTDPGVSSKHCVVRSAGDMVFVEDLKSRNGIKINGEPAQARVMDENGTIELGSTVIEITWVSTEREVPLASVPAGGAPTLVERSQNRTTERHITAMTAKPPSLGSTLLEETQMKEFQAAKAMLGQSIGGYLLLETIGIGGMGPLFRAKNVKSKDEVALKLVRRTAVKTPELLAEFMKTTRTGLKIPGAVNLIEVVEDEKYVFVTMELHRGGRELQFLVSDGIRYAAPDLIKMFTPLIATLTAAHAKGVVHRDIRPSNILLTSENDIILLDLGMGRKTDAEGKSILATKEDALARVRYLAPEVTRVGNADVRADVFSLASVIYFAISGTPPFNANTPLEIVRKIRWDEPETLTGRGVTPDFISAINRALAKEREQRHASIFDFGKALEDAVK
jgi:pSer/pThr/pTyr-binding forkhead associated (FHA) protein